MACNVAVFFAAIDVIFLRIYCIAFHLMLYQNPQGDYVICNIRKLRRIIMKNGIEILMCIVSYAYVGALAQETSNGGIKHSSSAPSLRWYVQTPGHFVNSSYVSSSDDEDNQVKDNIKIEVIKMKWFTNCKTLEDLISTNALFLLDAAADIANFK